MDHDAMAENEIVVELPCTFIATSIPRYIPRYTRPVAPEPRRASRKTTMSLGRMERGRVQGIQEGHPRIPWG